MQCIRGTSQQQVWKFAECSAARSSGQALSYDLAGANFWRGIPQLDRRPDVRCFFYVTSTDRTKEKQWSGPHFFNLAIKSVRTAPAATDRSSNQSAEIGRTDDAGQDKHWVGNLACEDAPPLLLHCSATEP
jgi:hypothetical protein